MAILLKHEISNKKQGARSWKQGRGDMKGEERIETIISPHFLISCLLSLASCFLFLVSCSLFLIPYLLFNSLPTGLFHRVKISRGQNYFLCY